MLTFSTTCGGNWLFTIITTVFTFPLVIPGMSLAWSPDKRLSASSGSSVVCMLGFLHPPTSLARSLLWAIPAQHVRPVSWRIACLTSAAITDPNFSLSWQPQGHGLITWKNNHFACSFYKIWKLTERPAAPENIHTYPMEGFFVRPLTPFEIPILKASYMYIFLGRTDQTKE